VVVEVEQDGLDLQMLLQQNKVNQVVQVVEVVLVMLQVVEVEQLLEEQEILPQLLYLKEIQVEMVVQTIIFQV
tara:strand:+ start:29 stop:247 length:219 start_codon:yes stop_codon:yes gene_type:complete